MLAIRLPRDVESRLAALARKTGRTKTHYAREAILEHLQDLEDFYLAEQRMKRYSEKKTIPLEGVLRRHGLAR
ncbi:MAG TPA: TraY domain-containing protein [Vicinamibacteria bacterium]|nr:TraY domain-containing protein [Vicinamibacteria bacterium]